MDPQKNSTIKDVSFSSYLKPKQSNSQQNEDTELSIFDAHKYFSETNNPKEDVHHRQQQQDHPPLPQHRDDQLSAARIDISSVDYGYGRNFRTTSFRGTPTASSEASWNSRTGLLGNNATAAGSTGVASLRNSPSDHHHSTKSSSAGKKWTFLGRKCCCTGGKSVQVKTVITSESEKKGPVGIFVNSYNEKTSQNNLSRRRSSFTRDIIEIHQNKARVSASGRPFLDGGLVGFTFPILKNSSGEQTNNIVAKAMVNPVEDDHRLRRRSLEGLRPIMHELPVSGTFNRGSPVARDDDVGSDASSDLFEIESFSTQTTSYHMYRRRDSPDEEPASNARRIIASSNRIRRSVLDEPTPATAATSVAATDCYPPSEVSVDWSVTTAEGYDRARVNDFSASALRKKVGEDSGGSDGGKSRSNGLMSMGCRQDKAVSVGPAAVKCSVAERPPLFPSRVVDRPPRPPVASSHTMARLSLAYAA